MVVVKQPDGTLQATSLKVKFGYFKILNAKEKLVKVKVNEKETNLILRLSESGDVYFPEEIREKNNIKRKGSDISVMSEKEIKPKSLPHSPIKNQNVNHLDLSIVDEENIIMYSGIDDNNQTLNTNHIQNNNNTDLERKAGRKNTFENNVSRKSITMYSKISEDIKKIENNQYRKNSYESCSIKPKESFNDIESISSRKSMDNCNLNNEINKKYSKHSNARKFSSKLEVSSFNVEISSQNEKINLDFSKCWNNVISNSNSNVETLFYNNLVTEEEFNNDPWSVINSNNLAFRYNDTLYNWKAIAPIILHQLIFNKPLPESSLLKLTDEKVGVFSRLFGYKNKSNALKLDPLKHKTPRKHSNHLTNLTNDENKTNKSTKKSHNEYDNLFPDYNYDNSDKLNLNGKLNDINIRKDSKTDSEINNSKSKDDSSTNENTDSNSTIYYKKNFILSSENLKLLNLNEGKNKVDFTVYSRLQGNQNLTCFIYLWNYDSKIVISDVDGTITRSDFLGHVMPLFGRDWTHYGIVEFYRNIFKNGYKIIYLSARAYCQSESTKSYLNSINQKSEKMPEGPVILSPDGLAASFKREVIDKAPQKFKIPCLEEILNLFPEEENPFYAGFGNRVTVRYL